MKPVWLLFAALVVLAGGCATNMFRAASVDIKMTPNQSVEHTATLVGGIYSNVVTQIGCTAITRTDHTNSFGFGSLRRTSYMVQYDAEYEAPGSGPKTAIGMLVDNQNVGFFANVYGTTEDFAVATNAVALFAQECDQRHIPYKTFKAKSLEQGGPF